MSKKIAVIAESLWGMGGANRVVEDILKIYPQADLYALFGNTKKLSDIFKNMQGKIHYSFLQKFPLKRYIYRMLYPLWPVAVESFDLSNYDLVISSSYSVAKGVVTNLNTKHVAYVHTPARYLWDLKSIYFPRVRIFRDTFLNWLRIWDVVSASRADILISNSEFISKRIKKYWGLDCKVVYPPCDLFSGKLIAYKKRENYFVAGSPFEKNKGGEFLCQKAKELNINLVIIGKGREFNRLKRRYRVKNIEFLGWVSEEEKWEILSNARGFLVGGVEDFGMFPVEGMSAGTPVLSFNGGGVLESVKDGVSGMFFEYENFNSVFDLFCRVDWNESKISKSVERFDKDVFKREFCSIID